jgi:hypothetical protein
VWLICKAVWRVLWLCSIFPAGCSVRTITEDLIGAIYAQARGGLLDIGKWIWEIVENRLGWFYIE